MKTNSLALIALFTISLFSCDEERIRFTEAQPANVEADTEIRKDFQGRYFCNQDSSFLFIGEDRIVQTYEDMDININGANVEVNGDGESNAKIEFGSDSSKSLKFNIKADDSKDSVTVDGKFEDELFNLKEGDVAKYHKSYYFMNSRSKESSGFHVRILRKTSDGLIMCRIQSDSVLHLLEGEDFVTKQKGEDTDEDLWTLRPSRKELKKLIDRGLFSDVKAYRKQ